MSIEETKVEPYRLVLKCDECGGEMKQTGTVLTTNPPIIPHKCEDCGATQTRRRAYPNIQYKKTD